MQATSLNTITTPFTQTGLSQGRVLCNIPYIPSKADVEAEAEEKAEKYRDDD